MVEQINLNDGAGLFRRFVTCRSALLGSVSPEGWLCTRMIALALSLIADLNTSRGWMSEALRVPMVTSTHFVI